MKKTIFTGAGAAIITPMNADGSINFDKLGEIIDAQISGGTDAIIVCGTTGESSTMTDAEHIDCIRYAVKRTNGRIPVIAGTGSNDTSYAIALAKEAEGVGVDGLLIVTPYYNKTSQRGLVAHFTAIAESVHTPIILYNIPGRTGMTISVDTYMKLSKVENIVATKEASGNLKEITQLLANCDLDVYSGNDDQIVPIMALGGKGVISVMSNIIPKETHDICAFALENNIQKARELAFKYLEFTENLALDVNPIPIKEAMNLAGMNVGECRLPLLRMEQKNIDALKASMEKIGLI